MTEQQKIAQEIIFLILDILPYGEWKYTENILSKKDIDTLIEKIRSRFKLL